MVRWTLSDTLAFLLLLSLLLPSLLIMFITSTCKRPVSSWKALNLRKKLLMASSVRLKPLFFFSSRRRHTRLQGDWSSDVCSSDLAAEPDAHDRPAPRGRAGDGHEPSRRDCRAGRHRPAHGGPGQQRAARAPGIHAHGRGRGARERDRKSTRLNSSHLVISYAVFCLKT